MSVMAAKIESGNSHGGWTKWSTAFENFAMGIFGEDLCLLISESVMPKKRHRAGVRSKADEIDQLEEVHHKNGQWHLAWVALADEESQDKVTGSASEGGQFQRSLDDLQTCTTQASATKCAQMGRKRWITEHGGFLIPNDSALSHEMKKVIDWETDEHES